MAEPKGFLMVPVGFNPSGDLRALELDANDYLKVALAAWLEGAVDVKGYTGSAWKELLVDASGRAIVCATGVDGAAVRRDLLLSTTGRMLIDPGGADKLWSYDSAYADFQSNTALPAGNSTLALTAIPAGKVGVIHQVAINYSGTVAGVSLEIYIINPSGTSVCQQIKPVESARWNFKEVEIILEPLGYIRGVVYGATLNDDLFLSAHGYVMAAS